jgi:hypothetical protein
MYAAFASKERNIPQSSKENYNCYLTIENRTLFAYIKKKRIRERTIALNRKKQAEYMIFLLYCAIVLRLVVVAVVLLLPLVQILVPERSGSVTLLSPLRS